MKAICASLSIAVLLTANAVAQAQPKSGLLQFKLDPATTSIHWTLSATAHSVHGTFRLTSGEFQIDTATGNASGLVVIDATSGESGNSTRDRRMHREIIESDKFPTITFRPTHVNGKVDLTGPAPITVPVEGIFNLHGQDHPLQLSLDLRNSGNAVAVETRFEIPYVAWGMKDPSTFFFRVDKQVHIDLTTAAVPLPAQAHSPAASLSR